MTPHPDVARIRTALDGLTTAEVRTARQFGQSWAEIGAALGISKQAAHERFRHLD